MAIIHYPGYISRMQAALQQGVQLRAINDQVRRGAIGYVRVDGFVYIRQTQPASVFPPAHVRLSDLIWVPHFARKHHIIAERLYEQIIIGHVTGVVVVDHVFVIPTEPALLTFIENAK